MRSLDQSPASTFGRTIGRRDRDSSRPATRSRCNEMKKCPTCHRPYADDLNFCLEDGSVLRPYDNNEETEIYPQSDADNEETVVRLQPLRPRPVPPPSPTPTPPAPQQQAQRWTAAGVIGVIVVVLLWGGIKLAIWSADSADRTSQSVNSPSPSYPASASPSGSPVPLCVVLNNCPTPTPTPTVAQYPSPSSSPSVSASPSVTIAEPIERTLTTGTYQSERTIQSDGRAALLRLRLTINSDGTYLEQAYVTFHGTGISDLLGIEERGIASQANGQLILKDRLERKFDFETSSWSAWNVRSTISEQIRNVTPTTFQIYDNDDKAWFTFAKP